MAPEPMVRLALPPDEAPPADIADVALCVITAIAEVAETGLLRADRTDLVLTAPGRFGTAALASFAHLSRSDRIRLRREPEAAIEPEGTDAMLTGVLGIEGGSPVDRDRLATGLVRTFLTAAGICAPLPDGASFASRLFDAERSLPAPSLGATLGTGERIELSFIAFLAGRAAADAIAGGRGPVRFSLAG